MAFSNATKTIGSIFMNDGGSADDEIGIRGTSGSNLAYNTNGTFRWFGAGILDKPIRDFYLVDPIGFPSLQPGGTRRWDSISTFSDRVYFSGGRITISVNDFVIPEPAEYALVFGLFAIGFIFFRHFQKKMKNGGGEYGRN